MQSQAQVVNALGQGREAAGDGRPRVAVAGDGDVELGQHLVDRSEDEPRLAGSGALAGGLGLDPDSPRENASPSRAVCSGSSEQPSSLRPRRGSRSGFRTGDQACRLDGRHVLVQHRDPLVGREP
ncbi:hypothetical protein ACFRJ7_11775 [Streptomyces sp. NPDC056747]|uniref:hypothetical protein n=1 Tax=Streptomyces sp. NPDC056747 TaxID=3345935 RepID=UPI0036BAA654